MVYCEGGVWRRWCGAALRDWFGGQKPTADPCFALNGSTRQVVVGMTNKRVWLNGTVECRVLTA